MGRLKASSSNMQSFFFPPCNHIINIKKKSFSGEVKDSVVFPLFFLLHKVGRASRLRSYKDWVYKNRMKAEAGMIHTRNNTAPATPE